MSVAIAISVWVAHALHFEVATAGVFAGMIAMFSGPSSSGWGSGWRRGAGIAAVIPVALGIIGGAYVPSGPAWTVVLLAAVAAFAAWTGRFGMRVGALSQLTFISFYFALLLASGKSHLASALLAATTGVTCTWIANLLPPPSGRRQIRGGLDAVTERVSKLLTTAAELLSANRGHAWRTKALPTEIIALGRSTTFLMGVLDVDSPLPDWSPERTRTLRLKVFDIELAADRLVTLLTEVSERTVTEEELAILASELVAVRARSGA